MFRIIANSTLQHNSHLIASVEDRFKAQYRSNPELVSLAPGRINIIGEHTDYNDGLAMPAAINRYVCTGISHSSDEYVSVLSTNYNQSVRIPLSGEFESDKQWTKFLSAIIKTLRYDFGAEGGANLVVDGDIPIGCGLSSSTAFVISITAGLCQLFGIDINGKDLAILE